MPRHGGRRRWGGRVAGLGGLAAVALVLTACASTASLPGHDAASQTNRVRADGPPANPAQVAVVRRWASALRAGNLHGAAVLFHLPSVFDDGASDSIVIRSLAEAEAANSTLSCGAVVISAFRQGRFINVLFRLTARAGENGGRKACGSGIGETARTDFLIRGGQILSWQRAPSLPGDPGAPGSGGGGKSGGGNSGSGNSGSGNSGSLPV